MLLYLGEPVLLLAELAFGAEGADDFADNTGGTPDTDVFVAHRTVLVQDKPILNAALAE